MGCVKRLRNAQSFGWRGAPATCYYLLPTTYSIQRITLKPCTSILYHQMGYRFAQLFDCGIGNLSAFDEQKAKLGQIAKTKDTLVCYLRTREDQLHQFFGAGEMT